jgi:Na+-translocating ferredoxin:NAD+ oxidoreductase subunit B
MFYEITAVCAGCGMCAKRCPAEAISGERRQQHHIDPSLCKQCGACWRQCPKAAVLDPQGGRRQGKPVKELPRAHIDASGCAGCRNCQLNCPFGAIGFERSRLRLIAAAGRCIVDPDRCYGCGTCISGCPTGAAAVYGAAEGSR